MWGWGGGIQARIFSFNKPSGWMDNLQFYGFFFNIIPVISGRREEDKIKLYVMEPLFFLAHVFHVSSEGKVARMCVLWGEGGEGSGW